MVGKRDAEILGGLDGHCFPVVITIYPGSTLPMVVIFEVSGIMAFCWEKLAKAIFEAEGVHKFLVQSLVEITLFRSPPIAP